MSDETPAKLLPAPTRAALPTPPEGVDQDWWESHHLPELGGDNLGYGRYTIDLLGEHLGTGEPGMALAIILSKAQIAPQDIVTTYITRVGPDSQPFSVTFVYLNRPRYEQRLFELGNEQQAARAQQWRRTRRILDQRRADAQHARDRDRATERLLGLDPKDVVGRMVDRLHTHRLRYRIEPAETGPGMTVTWTSPDGVSHERSAGDPEACARVVLAALDGDA